jgi:methionyl aminopeptidase
MIACKSAAELAKMRVSGRVNASVLAELCTNVAPGITTKEIDGMAERLIRARGGEPAFLGYHGFSGSICLSINEEVVHGIPGERQLHEGDLLKLDIGSIVDGWYSDMACTVGVGQISSEAKALLEATEEALFVGIREMRPGAHVSDIGFAVQSFVEGRGYSVVRQLVGHGIGRKLHEEPQVPNFGKRGAGVKLKPGMVLAVEPMVNQGEWQVFTKPDKWTVVTADGKLSAHFEHTVAVAPDGYEILTVTDDVMAKGGWVGSTETERRSAQAVR